MGRKPRMVSEWVSDEGGGTFVDLKQYVGREVTVVLKEMRTCILQMVVGPLIGVDEDKKVVYVGRGVVLNVEVVSKSSTKKMRLRPNHIYAGVGAVEPIQPGKKWAVNWITVSTIPGKLIREVVVRDDALGNITVKSSREST